MMIWFEDCTAYTEALQEGEWVDQLWVVINNIVQFSLSVNYLWVGVYFRQASHVMVTTKERTGLAATSSCSDYTIAKYDQFSCAINLLKISKLLDSAWTFLVALGMSTRMGTSYLDILIHLHLNHCGIVNVHLLALPVYERNTGLVMFEISSQYLDVLCPVWRGVIIGILTDR